MVVSYPQNLNTTFLFGTDSVAKISWSVCPRKIVEAFLAFKGEVVTSIRCNSLICLEITREHEN
jgi:hypothetical protein